MMSPIFSRAVIFIIIVFHAVFAAPTAMAQQFDPLSRDGAELSARFSAMLFLGLEQGVIEACNGNVSQNGNKLITFTNAAEVKFGREYALMLAGVFGEGLRLGSGIGCDVDALQNYSYWADLYYAPTIEQLRQ